MMRRDEDVVMLYTPDFDVALLPYKDGRFSAVLIVPHAVVAPKDFGAFLTWAVWNQMLSHLDDSVGPSLGGKCAYRDATADTGVQCDATLVMPKFTLEYQKDLTQILPKVGYPVPAGLPEFCGDCFLSKVIQKTYLAVDEKGTTAAAATGGSVAASASIPLVVDRPFALALIDNATDAPCFSARSETSS